MAAILGRRARARNPRARRLPALWLFTDPDRTPDALAAAARLPRGAGVVLRSFGREEVEAAAPALSALCRARGLVLLVGRDAALAARVGAAGVHLPEREAGAARRLRARHPRWILTCAAHTPAALAQAARYGVDAAFASAVFASRSPSAGAALGPIRFAGWVRQARLPVYALGGVDGVTAARLIETGAAGLAAVDALRI